jgi:alkylation response protein AidB-like acyl-CoA dehydrogenase
MVAAGLLRAAGGQQANLLLERLSQGNCAVLAWSEAGVRDDFADIAAAAERDDTGWVLDGAKALVTGGAGCRTFIVAGRTGAGLSLFAVPADAPGVTVHPYATIDGRGAADLVLDTVRLPFSALLGEDGRALPLLEQARDHAIVLQVTEASGLFSALLEQTIDYTTQRRQFGQLIADFQALQHAMVDMYLECELTDAAMWVALEGFDKNPEERARACSAAQIVIARACRLIGQKVIQLHGGMGMTDELPATHYARRALIMETAWGDPEFHLDRVAAGA